MSDMVNTVLQQDKCIEINVTTENNLKAHQNIVILFYDRKLIIHDLIHDHVYTKKRTIISFISKIALAF